MTTSPALTLEVVDPKLALIVRDNQLEPESVTSVLTTFQPLIVKAREWEAKADIKVTDASQTSEMKLARTVRLGLREVRINSDKTRKRLKESSLRQSRAIDSAYNLIAAIVEPLEQKLQAQEDYVEVQEVARKAGLKAQREALLAPFAVDTSVYILADMSEPQFNQLLASTKLAHEAKAQAALAAETARLAKEAEEAKQREAVRVENDRLRAEAAQKDADLAAQKAESDRKAKEVADKVAADKTASDAAAKKDRDAIAAKAKADKDKADALLAAERKKTADAAAETKRIKDADDARVAKEKADKDAETARVAAAAKAAARAPDKAKMLAFAALIEGLTLPTLTTPEGKTVLATLKEQNTKYATWVRKQGETL